MSTPASISAGSRTNRGKRARPKLPRKKSGDGNGIENRTPAQLERQERVFALSVMHGQTVRQIAKLLKIDLGTVLRDIRAEEARRSEELGERREGEKARAVAFYEGVADKALRIAANPKMPGDSGRLTDALKARERIDKIIGLDAPVQMEVGIAAFLDALKPPE